MILWKKKQGDRHITTLAYSWLYGDGRQSSRLWKLQWIFGAPKNVCLASWQECFTHLI